MKKIVFSLILAGLLVGCGNEEVLESEQEPMEYEVTDTVEAADEVVEEEEMDFEERFGILKKMQEGGTVSEIGIEAVMGMYVPYEMPDGSWMYLASDFDENDTSSLKLELNDTKDEILSMEVFSVRDNGSHFSDTFAGTESAEEIVTLEKLDALSEGMTYEEVVELFGAEGEKYKESKALGTGNVSYKWSNGELGSGTGWVLIHFSEEADGQLHLANFYGSDLE